LLPPLPKNARCDQHPNQIDRDAWASAVTRRPNIR
jgi:hypothetical protein